MKKIATLAAAGGLVALAATPALAQDMSQEEQYYAYRTAVVAYERCNGVTFDQDESTALEGRITQLIGGFLSPGLRLTIVVDAKDDMAGLVHGNGCGFDPVEDALALFESDLAPALGS